MAADATQLQGMGAALTYDAILVGQCMAMTDMLPYLNINIGSTDNRYRDRKMNTNGLGKGWAQHSRDRDGQQ